MAGKSITNNNQIEFLKFNSKPIQTAIESVERDDNTLVKYGINNRYPEYLLRLFNESPIHASIINSKANYIIGDGLKYMDGTPVNVKVNAADTFDEFVGKVIKDYLIFNFFAVEVIYNNFKQPIEYHFIPAQNVRTNKTKTKFWVSDLWPNGKPITFDRWKPVPTDTTSKIYFFDGYNPSINKVYSTPEYTGCITSLENDIAIREFNLNNIKNQFSVSTIITFFRGNNVSEEVKQKVVRDLKESYTGESGKKMIVDFQDPTAPAADVKNISPGEWDKAYELIGRSVKDDIMQGHQITSPMLFGVKTEGQLGGATELETSYEIFQNTYVRSKRNELLSAFNELFAVSELVKGQLIFIDKQLFGARISDSMKEKVYTINEIRADAGLQPIPNGYRLLTDENVPAPTKLSNNKVDLTEEDFEKIKDLGEQSEQFEFIEVGEYIRKEEDFKKVELHFETIDEIANYIMKNDIDGMSLKDLKATIRKELGINVTVSELKGMLNSINKANIVSIDISGDEIKVTPIVDKKGDDEGNRMEVRYTYDTRPGMGAPIIPSTRPFCRRLVENNRYYTREDIQQMSTIFGYDIYSYGGGYYTTSTGEIITHCRHFFRSVIVRKK